MPRTLKQLLQKTDAGRFERAQKVRVTQFKYAKSRVIKVPVAIAQTYSQDKKKGDKVPKWYKYATRIEFHDKGKVKVGCSCSDFLYTFSYLLEKNGAATQQYSNGDPPESRNPRNIVGVCKHVIALTQSLAKKGLLG